MAAHRLRSEWLAGVMAASLALGLPLAAFTMRWVQSSQSIEVHARVAEDGGWGPTDLVASVGQPLRLRLISDDVMHGFAIGQSETPAIDLPPGQMVETTLTFDHPGKYVFYCTRWCGPNHWRMRGTIDVVGAGPETATQAVPLYVTLGLNIDERPDADVIPANRPSAIEGAALAAEAPSEFFTTDSYRSHTPVEVWRTLRASVSPQLSDGDVWNLVAFMWRSNTTSAALMEGQTLYAANCAACHGETGQGDGVAGTRPEVSPSEPMAFGTMLQAPRDFTDPAKLLSASPALLQGKLIRGGMGTGMPYWGPIFTDAQTWALVDFLWTFQFQYQESSQ